MKIGVIDLGTNTFNLLIAEITKDKKGFKTLLNTKSAVMLGSEGLDKGYLTDKAFTRAYSVLRGFRKLLDEFKCDKEIAFGTSALRSAGNAKSFAEKVETELNIKIETISGDKEAELIYSGVRQAVDFTDEPFLILDIGGGSNEFIIADKDKIFWKKSFALGGARLHERFQPSDPISATDIKKINSYLKQELMPLTEALNKFKITKLVGSSGAFDTYAEINHYIKHGTAMPQSVVSSEISIEEFENIYKKLIKSNRKERMEIPGMESIRVDTIVMASVFTKLTLELSNPQSIIQSAYSLKEGVIAETENL